MYKLFSITVVLLFSSQSIFSQEKIAYLSFSANRMTVSNDATVAYYVGGVAMESDEFSFRGADSVFFNSKENTLSVFRCKTINAKSFYVTKTVFGEEYIVIKLRRNQIKLKADVCL